jgi:hypothetical protein
MGIILLFAMCMSISFIYVIPPFENPDEVGHVAYVIHLVQTISLPRVEHKRTFLPAAQGYQPPLYYISCVPLALLSGSDFTPERPPRNRKFKWKPVLPGKGEHRKFRPLTKDSNINAKKTEKMCIRLRWISVLWGMMAGLLVGMLLWRLSAGSGLLSLAGLSLFALNPRWLETCASVSNDVAATCMATLVILLLVELILSNKAPSLLSSLSLGLICALAALTKLNCAGLIPLAAIILLICTHKNKSIPILKRLIPVTVFFSMIMVLLFPWLLRNFFLYDHFFSIIMNIEKPFSALRTEPMGPLAFFSQEFQGFRYSYWAVFGQFGVLAHNVVYKILDLFLIAGGILGSLFVLNQIVKSKDIKLRLAQMIPLAWIVILFISFLHFNRMIYASQGRLFFPAGGCIAYILAGGFVHFLPGQAKKYITGSIILVMAVFCLYILFFVLIPAFRV